MAPPIIFVCRLTENDHDRQPYAGPMRTHASWWNHPREIHQDQRPILTLLTNRYLISRISELHHLTLSPDLSLNNTVTFKESYRRISYGDEYTDVLVTRYRSINSDLVQRNG
jgi:hypothetical protein